MREGTTAAALLNPARHPPRLLDSRFALPPILGARLNAGDVLEPLGEAVRPLIDFNVMGLRLLALTGQGFEHIATTGSAPTFP